MLTKDPIVYGSVTSHEMFPTRCCQCPTDDWSVAADSLKWLMWTKPRNKLPIRGRSSCLMTSLWWALFGGKLSGWLEYSLLVKKSSLLSFACFSGQILKLCPKKKSSAAYSFCKAMGLLGMQFHLFENECKNLQNTEISQFEFIHFVIKDVGCLNLWTKNEIMLR